MPDTKTVYDPREHLLAVIERVRSGSKHFGVVLTATSDDPGLKSAENAAKAGPLKDVQRHINKLLKAALELKTIASDRLSFSGDADRRGTTELKESPDALTTAISGMTDRERGLTMLLTMGKVTSAAIITQMQLPSVNSAWVLLSHVRLALKKAGIDLISVRQKEHSNTRTHYLQGNDAARVTAALERLTIREKLDRKPIDKRVVHVRNLERGRGCAAFIATVVGLLLQREKLTTSDVALVLKISKLSATGYLSLARKALLKGGVVLHKERIPEVSMNSSKDRYAYHIDTDVREAVLQKIEVTVPTISHRPALRSLPTVEIGKDEIIPTED